MRPTDWWMLKETVYACLDDYASSMGAALAYYALFSIAPMLLIVIAVAGLFFGADQVQGAPGAQLGSLLGAQGAQAVNEMLTAANRPSQGGIATIVSFGVLVVAATTVFAELQSALGRIWRARAREQSCGLWSLVRARLLSLWYFCLCEYLFRMSFSRSRTFAKR